jgi:hypothetical protein
VTKLTRPDQQTFVEEADECALLAVPPHHYNGGGCGGGKTATAGVDAAVKEMADPDSGDLSLIGDSSNGDYCYNDPASTIAIALQEMAHSWGAAHADGMIWTNTDGKNVNHHTPMMLGDGQANNCGYDYDYNSSYDDRFVEGYTDCAADNIPYSVMSYSESEVKNL